MNRLIQLDQHLIGDDETVQVGLVRAPLCIGNRDRYRAQQFDSKS